VSKKAMSIELMS